MSTLMADDAIHDDILHKLWQAYSEWTERNVWP